MPTVLPEWVWTPQGCKTGVVIEIDGAHILGLSAAARHRNVDVPLPGHLVVPGLVNSHSHAFQRAFRGHVQWAADAADDFWSWRERMYAVAGAITPDDLEAVSALAFLEMVEAGVTTVGEFHYLHHPPGGGRYADPDELARRVLAAADRVGLRIVLLRVAYGRHSSGAALQGAQLRFGDRSPDDVLAAIDRLRATGHQVGLAPHSVRAVPRDWLRELSAALAGLPRR